MKGGKCLSVDGQVARDIRPLTIFGLNNLIIFSVDLYPTWDRNERVFLDMILVQVERCSGILVLS
jgi:hypothetical protein